MENDISIKFVKFDYLIYEKKQVAIFRVNNEDKYIAFEKSDIDRYVSIEEFAKELEHDLREQFKNIETAPKGEAIIIPKPEK